MTGPRQLPSYVETERLTLRLWEPADAPAMADAVAESLDDLLPWMEWAAFEPLSMEERQALIAGARKEWRAGGDAPLGIHLGDRFIGSAGFLCRVGPGALEIGYWIHSAHVGHGYATEATRALTSLAFTLPEIEQVEIHHDKANVASRGVPQRLGFTLIREVPREKTAPGEIGIECQWVMARGEWTADG